MYYTSLPQNHNNSEFFCLKAETWKYAYILYENVKLILPNLVQTFVLFLIFIVQEAKQIIWLIQPKYKFLNSSNETCSSGAIHNSLNTCGHIQLQYLCAGNHELDELISNGI